MNQPIELAHEPSFAIGPLQVLPSTHEISRDGQREVIEPRVMQVLVALAQANGAVVTRDELVFRCWGGRIVGDDAIHRVLSRLRKLADGLGRGAFRLETVTRVGYRIIRLDAKDAGRAAEARNPLTRRSVVVAGVATIAAGTTGLIWTTSSKRGTPAEASALIERADEAMREGGPDQIATAASLYRKATQIAPSVAQSWGGLALAYRFAARGSSPAQALALETRMRSAAARALELDPNEGNALAALATIEGPFRKWKLYDDRCRSALTRAPNHEILNAFYGLFLWELGCFAESVGHFGRAIRAEPLAPHPRWALAIALWGSGRLEEADAAIDEAIGLFPRQTAVWFSRVLLLTYTGRTRAALAMIADADNRPIGVPAWNFELSRLTAQSLDSRSKADIDRAMAAHMNAARRGVGFVEAAIGFASAINRVDEAFYLIDAYFFGRGFQVGPNRWSEEQGLRNQPTERHTRLLFSPPEAALRRDPRFEPLVTMLGLDDYWRRSGRQPDYRRT